MVDEVHQSFIGFILEMVNDVETTIRRRRTSPEGKQQQPGLCRRAPFVGSAVCQVQESSGPDTQSSQCPGRSLGFW